MFKLSNSLGLENGLPLPTTFFYNRRVKKQAEELARKQKEFEKAQEEIRKKRREAEYKKQREAELEKLKATNPTEYMNIQNRQALSQINSQLINSRLAGLY